LSWAEAEAQSHRDIQLEFGDTWITVPMSQRPNFPAMPDPTRPSIAFTGVFEWQSANIGLGLEQVSVSSRKPLLTFIRCDIPYELKRADQLQRCDDGTLFEIKNVDRDGVSGAVAEMVQLGRQS
jgi:hypothetical protein